VRPATGHTSTARAARRVLFAVTSAALAAGVIASTASMATAGSAKPAACTRQPLAAPPFLAGIVAQPFGSPDHPRSRDIVKILSSATGSPAAALRARGSQNFSAVSRLGDDQTFVAATHNRRTCSARLVKFTIDQAGQPSAVTPLGAPMRGEIEELTASADGSMLAFELSPCTTGGKQVGVIDVATGQATRWDTAIESFAGSLSLTADGSELGFLFTPDANDNNATNQAWIKPANAPAGPLLNGAHQIPGLGASAVAAVLSPNGRKLWIEAQKTPHSNGPVALSLITTRTGTLVRKVTRLSPGGENPALFQLALDNAGKHMLAFTANPGPGQADVETIDLRSGQVSNLAVTNPVVDGGLTTFAW
jgi:hypothetical protein